MILIDSNFFIALSNKSDQWHERANEILLKLEKEERIIADVVILEAITLTGKLSNGKKAKALYDNLKDNYEIVGTNNLYDIAMNTYLHYDGTLSLADVLLLEIMDKLNINKIVSFDSDFDKVKGIKRIH